MPLSVQIILFTAAVLALAERAPTLWRRRSRLLRANAFTDVAFLAIAWLAIAQLTLTWVAWATGTVHGALGLPTPDGVPLWLEIVVAIVLLDLGNYVAHWLLHRIPWLWRVHAVHHSSPMLDWLATFRSHLLEQLLRRLVAPLLLIAIGVSPAAVAIGSAIFLAWAILNHSNLRVNLRFLEPVFITPRLHHLHHIAASSENNLGTMLNIWDRLAGRLSLAEVDPETRLGNGHRDYPQSFWALLRAPFRRASRAVGRA